MALGLLTVGIVPVRVLAIRVLAVGVRTAAAVTSAHGSAAAVSLLGRAVKLGRGPAGLVDDGLLLVAAVRVHDVDAGGLLLGRERGVEDSVADALCKETAFIKKGE